MPDPRSLTRAEIIDCIDQLADDPKFAQWRDFYLNQAVYELDPQWTEALLKLGANPNYVHAGYDSLLHTLFEHLRAERTTKLSSVLSVATVLLKHGADPNLVGPNNFRAVDLAVQHGFKEFANLLLAAGADPNPRPFV